MTGGIQHAAPSEMLPPAPPAVQEVRNHQSHRVTSRCQGPPSPSDARAWVVSFPSPALTVHPGQHTLQGPVALFSLIPPTSKTASEAALTERGPCAACLHSESVLRNQIANKPCPSTFPMLSPMQPLTQDRLRVAVCQEVKELHVTPVCHSGARDPGQATSLSASDPLISQKSAQWLFRCCYGLSIRKWIGMHFRNCRGDMRTY